MLLLALLVAAAPVKPSFDDLLQHPVRDLSFWRDALWQPVEARFGGAPAELSDYLGLDNAYQGYSEHPVSVAPSPELMTDFQTALGELPESVRQLMRDKLLGVFTVKDLGTSAYTEAVFGADGAPAAGVIVIDVDALNRRANDWCTWKENTPFQKKPASVVISCTLEPPERDDRARALEFILLHEMGHVASIGTSVHPPWSTRPARLDGFSFARLSWVGTPRYAMRSPERSAIDKIGRVTFYSPAERAMKRELAPDIYRALGATSFASLYATQSPEDDFAEAFAIYVHAVLMKRPYRIDVTLNDESVAGVRSCFGEARCADKRAVLEAVLR